MASMTLALRCMLMTGCKVSLNMLFDDKISQVTFDVWNLDQQLALIFYLTFPVAASLINAIFNDASMSNGMTCGDEDRDSRSTCHRRDLRARCLVALRFISRHCAGIVVSGIGETSTFSFVVN